MKHDHVGCDLTARLVASRRAAGYSPLDRDFDVTDLARQLASVYQGMPAETETNIDAAFVRRQIAVSRTRYDLLPPGLHADPAWDMLLDLTLATLERKLVSTTSLCLAANVPTTTALRWIKTMVDGGLLERCADPRDGRRTHILLSSDALRLMLRCLTAIRRLSAEGD